MLWVLKNQLGRRNLGDFQFKLLVGQEYELEKKVSRGGGDRKSEEANQIRQNGGIDHPKETAEKIAEGIGSRKEVLWTSIRGLERFKLVESRPAGARKIWRAI